MLSKAQLLLLLAGPTALFATPTALTPREDIPTITICKDPDFKACKSIPVIERVFGYCFNLKVDWKETISSYKLDGACCAFYKGAKCNGFIWVAENKEESKLQKGYDNAVSSFMCGRDCEGLPPAV